MRTPVKIAVYLAGLAVAFAGALGVGGLVGSPVDRSGGEDEPAGAHAAEGEHGGAEGGAERDDPMPAGLQVSESGYTLSPIDAPASVGEPGRLSFRLHGPDGEPVTELTETHERDLHLIVVRTDTARYRHVHPALDAAGTWSVDWQWDAAGTYKVFADFQPAALDDGLTLTRIIEVAGDYAPAPPPADAAVAEVDGYTVTLTGALAAGESSLVTATVERDGRPVTSLQPYLGAYGHLVALRTGDLAYAHVHPEGEPPDVGARSGPAVSFSVEAPTTGSYRLFFEFQVAGRVTTAEFTLTTTDH